MKKAGIEVLYDDRDVSPGIKFSEADLRGIPIRLLISERSHKNGGAELKLRTSDDGTLVTHDELVDTVRAEIDRQFTELRESAASMPVWQEGQEG